MNFQRNLGRSMSLFFLLALSLIEVAVYHVANGALEKINHGNQDYAEYLEE